MWMWVHVIEHSFNGPGGGSHMGTRVRAGCCGPRTAALSEQVPSNSGPTEQGSLLPEARARPSSKRVFQMVLQVSDRWGTSMSPCHLPFPRSHFPDSPHAASAGAGAWL